MKKVAPILVLLFFAASAWAQKVRYNFDSQADFSKYKTYRWERSPDSMKLDDLTRNELGQALDSVLATKGLTRVTGADADLLLVYQVAVREQKELTTISTGFGYGPGWGGGWYGAGWYGAGMGGTGVSTTTTNTIMIGSLDVDMYDAAKKDMVWRGVATKAIDVNAKPQKRQKNMEKAAKKLFKNYPPPQK
jgi:uncharacterized spore protein YtfJ